MQPADVIDLTNSSPYVNSSPVLTYSVGSPAAIPEDEYYTAYNLPQDAVHCSPVPSYSVGSPAAVPEDEYFATYSVGRTAAELNDYYFSLFSE